MCQTVEVCASIILSLGGPCLVVGAANVRRGHGFFARLVGRLDNVRNAAWVLGRPRTWLQGAGGQLCDRRAEAAFWVYQRLANRLALAYLGLASSRVVLASRRWGSPNVGSVNISSAHHRMPKCKM